MKPARRHLKRLHLACPRHPIHQPMLLRHYGDAISIAELRAAAYAATLILPVPAASACGRMTISTSWPKRVSRRISRSME
jgi:hypothetical protein